MGGDSNLYGYVLGDPVNFVDVLGLLPFDEDGQEALEYWINKADNSSGWRSVGYNILAGFAALWTPDTSRKTTFVLGSAEYLCASIRPKVLYHFTGKEAAEEILKKGLILGNRNYFGKGVYATRYNSRFIARLQGAKSTEAKIIIKNTSLFRHAWHITPGVFRTRNINVPPSMLTK